MNGKRSLCRRRLTINKFVAFSFTQHARESVAIVKKIFLEIFTDIHVSALLSTESGFLGTLAACMLEPGQFDIFYSYSTFRNLPIIGR
jgi:hypothetical protein